MNNFYKKIYKVELTDDSKVANIYSPKGKLAASFIIEVENNKVALYDKENDILSIIPTDGKVVSVKPFEYDRDNDTLSVKLNLNDNKEIVFTSTVYDLMNAKNFDTPTFCEYPPLHHHKPQNKPLLDKFITYNDLMTEAKLREREDNKIMELLGDVNPSAAPISTKIRNLEFALRRNDDNDRERSAKLNDISNSMEELRCEVRENLYKLDKDIRKENKELTDKQDSLYDKYVDLRANVNKCDNQINKLNENLIKEQVRAINVERDIYREIEKKLEDNKNQTYFKNLYDIIEEESCKRKESDKRLEKLIHDEHCFTIKVKTELENDIKDLLDGSNNEGCSNNSSKFISKNEFYAYQQRTQEQFVALQKVIEDMQNKIANIKI